MMQLQEYLETHLRGLIKSMRDLGCARRTLPASSNADARLSPGERGGGGEGEADSRPPPPPVSLRVGPLAALSWARAHVRRLLRRVAAVGDVRGAVEDAALVRPRQRRTPAS